MQTGFKANLPLLPGRGGNSFLVEADNLSLQAGSVIKALSALKHIFEPGFPPLEPTSQKGCKVVGPTEIL